MSRNLLLLVATTLLVGALAGCVSTDDEDAPLVLAFTRTDDDMNAEKDPQLLADYLSNQMGRDVEIFDVGSSQAAIEAMRAGQADVGFFDGAAGWFAWKSFNFEAVAADLNSDGRSYYVAAAWVRSDAGITEMEQLRGMRSCHTGLLKSAGMFMPLGWMIGNDLVDVQGDDDLASIEPTVLSFFSEASIPSDGPYAGYAGALRCLSEGQGDVAFIKDSTPESYCGDGGEDWCLPLEEYTMLQPFGQVPSHPIMVRPDLDAELKAAFQSALLSLNEGEAGEELLEDILETDGLVATTSQDHLGQYGAAIQHVPGIQTYIDGKLN